MLRHSSRARLSVRWLSRSWKYAALGAVVALGAPVGLLALRVWAEDAWPWSEWFLSWGDWVRQEIFENRLEYAYLLFTTPAIFALLGFFVGRTQQRLENQALMDRLTGLPNRAYFETRLASDLARASRYRQALSMLIIDLDDLKGINDRSGHLEGDDALRAVAEAVRKTVRETDFAARLGGDEFVVIAPSTSGHEAMELAKRVRLSLEGVRTGTTVSIGVADVPMMTGERTTADRLLRAADEALYVAKLGGRNREQLAGRGSRKESGSFERESRPSQTPSVKAAG